MSSETGTLPIIFDMTPGGYAVVRSFEGRALKAYRDSVGVWTIGYGNTNYDKWAVSYLGKAIGAGMTITEDQAEYLLRESIRRGYAPMCGKVMPGATPNALDAGISFHYNTGAIARASWVKLYNSKQMASVRASLLSWNKAGGKVLAGLTRRRNREASMILTSDYGPEGRNAPPVLNAAGNVVAGKVVVPASSPDHHLAGTPGMLRNGDSGPECADLNQSLIANGFATCKGGEKFDDATEAAVRAVQKAHPQLDEDGIAGPATRAVVNREADIKRKLKVQGGSGIATQVGTAVADAASGGAMPMGVYIALVLFFGIVLAVTCYNYRDELAAIAKR